MTQINAYLTFNGNCREAMTFYQNCFGGHLTLLPVEESPMANQWPSEVQKHILHACLEKEGLVLLASDMKPEQLVRGNTISLAIKCSSEEEINRFFNNLSVGGKVTHALHKFFDGTIGALMDKYGMNWLFKL
jgi:PhnB protein